MSKKTSGQYFSRKEFLKNSGAATAGLLASPFFNREPKTAPPPNQDKLLFKGGVVLTMDDDIGDFETADILVEGDTIAEVASKIDADADSEVIDSSNRIIMPGFVDTHRHMWQGCLRNILPNGLLSDYMRVVTGEGARCFVLKMPISEIL